MSGVLRVYADDELSVDGYPVEWHRTIKHLIREQAGNRCVRCGHPYLVGQSKPEWSPCDEHCEHGGPIRARTFDGELVEYVNEDAEVVMATVARSHIEARWRVLTVHHLTGDKADCRWWNLAALCQRCHLTIQGKVRMDQHWPFEHTDWFKPYAAGYYAATILGEPLDREQTLARLDELLALEHRQDRLPGIGAEAA